MGSSTSRPSSLAPTFERLASWDIKSAKRLLTDYKEKDLDFGLDAHALAEICSGDRAWAEAIIDAFGGTNGIINALAYICGTILVSSGAAVEKVGLVFDALDFDLTEQISMDEMTIVFMCCARGYSVMSASGNVPSDEALENVTLQAYRELSKSGGNSITKTEFTKWVLKFIGTAPTAVPHAEVTLEDMAIQFGLVRLPPPSKSLVDDVLSELAAENNTLEGNEPVVGDADVSPHEETPVSETEGSSEPKQVETHVHEDEGVRSPAKTTGEPMEMTSDPAIDHATLSDDEHQAKTPLLESVQRPPSASRGEVDEEPQAHEPIDTSLPIEQVDVAELEELEPTAAPMSGEIEPDATSARMEEANETPADLNAYETYDYMDKAYDGSSGLEPPDPFDEPSQEAPPTEPTEPTAGLELTNTAGAEE